ncbi:MAG: SDR family oxidoreductase [Pararhodobacter sp.]|nr:SDR family oxidoreductase [Pararhodobacter sp.]
MQDLFGRTALIAGGSSGMGRAVAGLFVARGAEVVLTGRCAQKVQRATGELGTVARPLPFDISDTAQIDTALSTLPDDAIDHLIITAGHVTHGPFHEQDVSEVRQMFDSKFWGAYTLCRAALPKMRAGGSIVLVSGVLSRRPGLNCAGLGAVCAALEGLARGLALELGPRLRVNCVAPGMVRTPLHDRHPEDRREAMFTATGASLPVGRVGWPSEIAEAIVMVATNGYISGHVLDADGGHMIRQYATR